jgi:autoinducer 2-degrading protein
MSIRQKIIKEDNDMQVTLVHVHVKPDHISDFVEATRLNHEASIQERGNRRFDILQSAEDPSRFVLYEAYASSEDAAAHKQTQHYLTWRETVSPWMATPREGIPYYGLFPKD